MDDQASTLRKLMENRTQGAATAPTLTFASERPGAGKSCLLANLGACLARSGLRVLLLGDDLGRFYPGSGGIRQVSANLWVGSLQWPARIPTGAPDLILLDSDECEREFHGPGFESMLVLTPDSDACRLIHRLRSEAGATRFQVIVNRVTDGRHGQLVFRRLEAQLGRRADVRLEYLGHFPWLKSKILLDLDSGTSSGPCFELMAKRLKSKFLSERTFEVEHEV